MTGNRPTTMEERRDAQGDHILRFLADAQASGVHVYRPEELYPEVDFQDPHSARPRLDPCELLYDYGGAVYQVIFNGASVYHHRLIGTNLRDRPLRRHAPQPRAPWHEEPVRGAATD